MNNDTQACASIYTIQVDSAASSGFVVFTPEMLREMWLERHRDRLASGARYWRKRRLPGWLR